MFILLHLFMRILNVQPRFACAAIVSGGKGTAQGKISTLREAGVTVVESPAKIGAAMFDIFKQKGLVQ
jgi:succinyl-CoA synthetase alpha subunit